MLDSDLLIAHIFPNRRSHRQQATSTERGGPTDNRKLLPNTHPPNMGRSYGTRRDRTGQDGKKVQDRTVHREGATHIANHSLWSTIASIIPRRCHCKPVSQ